MAADRTHKLQLDSVTLNFRLWDGSSDEESPGSYDGPEYTTGRHFAEVEVHRLGVWIRTLNETPPSHSHIQRSLSPRELRNVLHDIDAAVVRVQQAGLLDYSPNQDEAEAEAELEGEEHHETL
jgi:hypothetical protein